MGVVTYRKMSRPGKCARHSEQTSGTLRRLHGALGPQLRAGCGVKRGEGPLSATSLPCDSRQFPQAYSLGFHLQSETAVGDLGEPLGACLL